MKYLYLVGFLLLFANPLVLKAQGNLLIIPKRVVFEGAKRVQEISIANTGTDSANYSASVVQYRMEKDGRFTEVTTPDSGQNFSSKYIRFFPRNVKLGPNEGQVIKMQLINTSELKPGEYRSHLFFRAIPKTASIADKVDSAAIRGEISVKLVAQYGLSIPIIIRVGQNTTTVSLTNAQVRNEDGKTILQMDMNRTGNMSVYGDIKINYLAPNGKIMLLNQIKGIAVYTPNSVRTVNILIDPKNIDPHKGKLQVIYGASEDAKPATYAETEVLLR